MKCKCNYHLGFGPNLLCPVHGKREDLARRIESLQSRVSELEAENKALRNLLEEAVNAIDWYRGMHPESDSGADDEFMERAAPYLPPYSTEPEPRK